MNGWHAICRTRPGAGQLYHSNEDVHRIAADLAARDHQLVVFVDDLDRCSPRSVAVVFEAINSLLMYSLAAPRFVIGLDTAVVASRLADSYSPNNGAWRSRDWDDPHIGWSLLRKLSQLAVVLPAVRSPHATRLLRRHAQPEPVQSPTHRDPPPEATAQPNTAPGEATEPGTTGPAADAAPVSTPRLGDTASTHTRPEEPAATPPPDKAQYDPGVTPTQEPAAGVSALEGEPLIQDQLAALMRLRPRQTMRETKRLLTLWVFLLRLLEMQLPISVTGGTQGARDVMTLAEIIVRWPALIPALARNGDSPSGLSQLIDAIAADGTTDNPGTKWSDTARQLGLTDAEHEPALHNLWHLLRHHGNERIAEFADHLL